MVTNFRSSSGKLSAIFIQLACLDKFWYKSPLHNLTKIRAVGVDLFHTDGQTETQDEPLVTFGNPAKSPKEIYGGVWRGIVWPKLAVLAGPCDETSGIIQEGKLWRADEGQDRHSAYLLLHYSCTYSSSIRHFRPDSPVACRSSGVEGRRHVTCCTGTLPLHTRGFWPTCLWLKEGHVDECDMP